MNIKRYVLQHTMDLESQWSQFMNGNDDMFQDKTPMNDQLHETRQAPDCSPLKISTKSKIIYLNSTFELNDLFWKLKIIPYDLEQEGIVKKQMKFNQIILPHGEKTKSFKYLQSNLKCAFLNLFFLWKGFGFRGK